LPTLDPTQWLALFSGLCALLIVVFVAFLRARQTANREAIAAASDSAAAWREERDAEKAKAERLEKQLMDQQLEWHAELEEQRDIRHKLKDELATERMKTDLTSLIGEMQRQQATVLKELASAVTVLASALDGMEERLNVQHERIIEALVGLSSQLTRRGDAAEPSPGKP
jgi:hypothetical protein